MSTVQVPSTQPVRVGVANEQASPSAPSQWPPEHWPEQQSAELAQVAPPPRQHVPPSPHSPAQQSTAVVQPPPSGEPQQRPFEPHCPPAQQSAFESQDAPWPLQRQISSVEHDWLTHAPSPRQMLPTRW
jgi:hypothetical protein